MTSEEFEQINVVPSYDKADPEHYKRFNQHPWVDRVGCMSRTSFICENCETIYSNVTIPTRVLRDVYCPKCKDWSCVFYRTDSIDVRFDDPDENEDEYRT